MPGFDGTGPGGMGPITGGGRGFCRPGSAWTGYRFPRRFGNAYPQRGRFTSWPAVVPMARDEELQILKLQATNLKRELEGIDERINELMGEAGPEDEPDEASEETDENK